VFSVDSFECVPGLTCIFFWDILTGKLIGTIDVTCVFFLR
jgi:hypothetical protein